MKTILFASRKGGSGKTTLLAHLAVQAMHEGEDVTIVDLDPQQNLKAWWEARAEDRLKLAQFPVAQFAVRLAAVRDQAGFCSWTRLASRPPRCNPYLRSSTLW